MNNQRFNKLGGYSIISGAFLFAFYSLLYPMLLPVKPGQIDFVPVIQSPYWIWLSVTAFFAICFMLFGFVTVYLRIRDGTGWTGFIGFLLIETAYLIQASKVTWEIFIFPVIVANKGSAFLFREGVLRSAPNIVAFRYIASGTILLGILLFCYALLRSPIFRRTAPGLIFAGALIYAIGPFFNVYVAVSGILILAFGCMILGIDLIRVKTASV